jgi:HlyD family secretion protein
MSGKKFLGLLGVLFLIALAVYLLTTPRGNAYRLIGVVDGNDVVVSPQITDRMIKLTVDEGSEVTKGALIAELDPAMLKAQLDAQVAAIDSLRAQVAQAEANLVLVDGQTKAALQVAQASYTSSQAQLQQAEATNELNGANQKRAASLFSSGVISAQDRDTAVATSKASDASVRSLADQVQSQRASLALAEANRKQVDVLRRQIASLEAQLAQGIALRDAEQTQLGYTKIRTPISGIVSVRVARQGEVVQEGSPIVVLVNMDDLWVRADVPETYIDAVQFGQTLPIELPSGDVVHGQVFFKGVEGDFATQRDVSRTKRDIRTFAIKVRLPNPRHRFFTGMTATVLLPLPREAKHWWNRF